MKIGTRFKLDGACQEVKTRDGKEFIIKPGAIVIRIKNTISDILNFRQMYRIDGTNYEVDIDNSLIKRYFIEIKND